MSAQTVDVAVSRAKFDREIAAFHAMEDLYRARGWLLIRAVFPVAEVAFITSNMVPRMVAFVARIDFTDYDLAPPSVRLIDPVSGAILAKDQLLTPLPRALPDGSRGEMAQGFHGAPVFLCVAGTREYHENPAHTGDSWFLHRGRGEGNLYFICDQISRYGSEPIQGLRLGSLALQVAEPQP